MTWTTETALNFLLQRGAKPDRDKKTGAPVIVLPPLTLRGCGAVDFLRKTQRVKLQKGKLVHLGGILHLIGQPAQAA